MSLFALTNFKLKLNFKDEKLLFLLIINIVPIVLIFITSMVMGIKIRTMWMTPFYLFFGVLVIYISEININKLKGFVSLFLILFIFSPFAYAYISVTEIDKRTDYPGKEISKIVENEWLAKYPNKKINIVGDDEWHAGNLSYHLKSRPKVVIHHWNPKEGTYFPWPNSDLTIYKCDRSGVCPFVCETKSCKFFEVNNFKFQILVHPTKG